MENNFNNRDFEQFVKQSADQYRMFPSEKVWRNIHSTLHTRNRWYGIGLVLLLLTAVTVTWVMLVPANKNQQLADKLPVVMVPRQVVENEPKNQAQPILITPARPANAKPAYIAATANQEENLFIATIPPERFESSEGTHPVIASATEPFAASIHAISHSPEPVVRHAPAYVNTTPPAVKAPVMVVTAPVMDNVASVEVTKEAPAVDASSKTEETISLKDLNLLTIESVVNSYTHITKKNKFYLQAYFTPTVSYRKLRENNIFISQAAARSNGLPASTTLAVADVNSVVTHKPDIGLQLGVNAGYRLTNLFTFTAGLQFNVNKYDIRAYNYPSETATIALTPGNIRPSSVSTETTYRNYSGSKNANWLHNLYFSASLPVGVEVKLSGRKKTEIGVGGTIQPTYLLGNRSYLLSTDYKNYAEVPSLIRKWNISTGFEAYAGYSTGKLSWRVGPQVRYQLMSSFREQYPVKEHLFDFGLKVGIMLNK